MFMLINFTVPLEFRTSRYKKILEVLKFQRADMKVVNSNEIRTFQWYDIYEVEITIWTDKFKTMVRREKVEIYQHVRTFLWTIYIYLNISELREDSGVHYRLYWTIYNFILIWIYIYFYIWFVFICIFICLYFYDRSNC